MLTIAVDQVQGSVFSANTGSVLNCSGSHLYLLGD